MKRSAPSLLALLAVLVLTLMTGSQADLPGTDKTHLVREQCASCHLGGGGSVGPQQARMLIASQEVLCGKCHQNAIRVSHPSGFAPRSKPPEAYPLDWKGDLTCSTCHEPHGTTSALLRGARSGRALCLTCHDVDFFKRMRDGGASLMAGHLSRGAEAGAPLLDTYSRRCMECHGGSAEPRIATVIDRNGIARHAGSRVNHPVGASYDKAATFGGYRPRRNVKLLLPDGLVSCVSCHHGYREEHGKLVVSQAGSRLCYECHDL